MQKKKNQSKVGNQYHLKQILYLGPAFKNTRKKMALHIDQNMARAGQNIYFPGKKVAPVHP